MFSDIYFLNDFCQWQVCGFLRGTPVSPTNKTDRHDITEILLKVVLTPETNLYQPTQNWERRKER